ncbi:MAG: DinB family protein [Longimicrobiales bacterium]
MIRAAQIVPADKYSYQPVSTVFTFGQLLGHITDGSNYYCGRAAGSQAQWSEANQKGPIDKATILPKLEQALAACTSQYNGNGQPGALVDNLAHTSLHYGNIVTYMHMLGLTPPSS